LFEESERQFWEGECWASGQVAQALLQNFPYPRVVQIDVVDRPRRIGWKAGVARVLIVGVTSIGAGGDEDGGRQWR
jgi:hypothetical protein